MLPGTSGFIVGPVVFISIGGVFRYLNRAHNYHLDPKGEPGAFKPFLAHYIRSSEFVVGLATGSIVLLVGSSAIHSQGRLPWFFASPLLLLGWSVLFGVMFMAWLIYEYEEYQHHGKHSANAYALSVALGFSSLVCFCFGYFWLVLDVTRG